MVTPSYQPSSIFNVKGLVALVTGGGTGLGLAMGQSLAAGGAKVYIAGRRKEVLEKSAAEFQGEHGGHLVPLVLDVTDKSSIANAVQIVKANDGKLDALVNSAGILGKAQPLWASPDSPERQNPYTLGTALFNNDSFEDWQDAYAANTVATYFVTIAFLELLQKGTKDNADYSSSVINISSCVGFNKFSLGLFPYIMSKGAVNHLTMMLAADFATRNIRVRVNSIAPGVFPSEINQFNGDIATAEEADRAAGTLLPLPSRRAGKEEEIAGAALYLISPAGHYTNGQIIAVDGGHSLVNPVTR